MRNKLRVVSGILSPNINKKPVLYFLLPFVRCRHIPLILQRTTMALVPTPSTTLLAICLSPSLCTLLPSQEKPPYVYFFIVLSFAFSSEVAGLEWPVTVVLHRGAELPGNFPEGCVSCFFGELYSRQWPAASWVR